MGLYAKSAGVCIFCRHSNRGFSHCPIDVRRQRRSPRRYMQSMPPAAFLAKHRAEASYYITTGVYRCTTLDINMKFCENFCSSRTCADIRFLCIFYIPPPSCPCLRAFRSGTYPYGVDSDAVCLAKIWQIFQVRNKPFIFNIFSPAPAMSEGHRALRRTSHV